MCSGVVSLTDKETKRSIAEGSTHDDIEVGRQSRLRGETPKDIPPNGSGSRVILLDQLPCCVSNKIISDLLSHGQTDRSRVRLVDSASCESSCHITPS